MLNKLYAALFSRENAEPLGLFRILVGGCILLTFLLDLPFVSRYYFTTGYVSLSSLSYEFTIFRYATNPAVIYGAYALLLIAAFFLTIGYRTRIASIITFLLVLMFHDRNTFLLTSGDSILRVLSFYLMISNSGAAYSIDSLIRKLKGMPEQLIPKWNRLLIKYQVSVFYFFAGISKTGATWKNGTAVYYALNNPNFARVNMPWLQRAPLLVRLLSWGALITELSAPFLLWVTRTRILAIAMVTVLQLGIFATMSIGTFQIISIIAVFIFLEKNEIDAFWKWLGGKKQYRVMYDGACQLCINSLQLIEPMDVMHKLTFSDFRKEKHDPGMDKELWLISDTKTYKGFYAFRKMAHLLPALWITVPFLYLPFAGTIGSAIYNHIACTRFNYCHTKRL